MDIETATAVPRSPVSCTVTARHHTAIQDKPAASGGQDEGMMASEHLLVALLSCQLSTFVKVAAKRKSDAQAVSIRGDLHFNEASDIEKVSLHWHLSGCDDKTAATLTRLTDKVCTISRVLSCPVSFDYELS
ncbi:MAG: OsmC family protein [Thermoplasmatota archaeon]